MKKRLLLAAFLMGSFFTVKAQTVIVSQDFSGTGQEIYDAGWGGLNFDGDTSLFGVYSENANITALGFTGKVAGSGNFTVANNAAVAAPTTDNAYWGPNVVLPADGDASLSVRLGSAALEAGALAPYEVYILTAEDVADFDENTTLAEVKTVLDGKTPISTGIAPAASTVMTYDLTSFAGQTVSVVFRHRNASESGLAYLFLDDVTFTTEGTVGVKEVLATQLSVFPNPTSNVINVTNANNILVNTISIVDLNGRTVKSVKFDGVAEAQVNISDLASGVYMMTIASDKGTTTKKIVKN